MPPRKSRRGGTQGNQEQMSPQTSTKTGEEAGVRVEVDIDGTGDGGDAAEDNKPVVTEETTAASSSGEADMDSTGSFVPMSAEDSLKKALAKGEQAYQAATAIIEQAKKTMTTEGLPVISNKHPTMMLNEQYKGLKYETISETGQAHNKCWTVSVEVEGQSFEGLGRNKRMAKSEAAKYALIKLFNILCVPEEKAPEGAAKSSDTGGGEPMATEGDDQKRGQKRQSSGNEEKAVKKLKGQPMPKNALVHLSELKPGVQYTVISQTGPTHSPIFTMSVEVNGQIFTGQGGSKKAAKLAAAEQALKSFLQFPNASDAHAALGHKPQVNADFTSDDNIQNFDGMEGMEASSDAQNSNGSILINNDKKVKKVENYEGKNPIMVLNELKPNMKYEYVSATGEKQSKMFTVAVTMDDQSFYGSARSKKLAKARAAQSALSKLFNLNFSWGPKGMPVNNSDSVETYSELADHIAKLVQNKFAELTDDLTSQYARRKVLAGMVITVGEDLTKSKAIGVTAGTKCINGEYLSDEGKCVNDFHAEILARRSLLRYLYSQLELIATDDPESMEQSIFEKGETGFKVKEGVKFHLYISTAPCGDSRIFSPHATQDIQKEGKEDKHPNRKTRGQLRTKIESGEGTIPVKSNVGVQTWDGVIHGERLLTMSCSDKIARWNLLGIQGALIGLYVEPIYLSSIVLGSLYHADHLARAVYKRFDTVEGVEEPYHVNKPNLSGINNPEHRQLGKAPNFAIDWCEGDEALEVINMTTGKQEQDQESRLCKRELFKRFLGLKGRLPSNVTLPQDSKEYGVMKAMNTKYQAVKATFIDHFQKTGLGLWVKKPVEQDEFMVADI